MHWLFDLFLDFLSLFPWENLDRRRSSVGESRLDRQSRWIEWTLLFVVGLGLTLIIYASRA